MHKYFLSPGKESYEILARSLRICSELRAEILHIQTPPSFNPEGKLKDIRDLFSSIDLGAVKLAWEVRGHLAKGTIELMHDLGIIHCTDITKEMPSTDSDIVSTPCSDMENTTSINSMIQNCWISTRKYVKTFWKKRI